MNHQHIDTCHACEQAIVGDDWEWRHSVSDTEADAHDLDLDLDLDAGEYHETCCPICSGDDEVLS